MEAIFAILKSIPLNIFHLFGAGVLFFAAGYWFARRKVKKIEAEIRTMEKNILDLNAELLFGKTETPVIRIKPTNAEKSKIIAK